MHSTHRGNFEKRSGLHVGESIRSNCDDGGIFLQLFWHDLVQSVNRSVVIIEIETAPARIARRAQSKRKRKQTEAKVKHADTVSVNASLRNRAGYTLSRQDR
jgi:hypothetical protein